MRVSRLEVFGFKSFMDRLVLPLAGGITGVVGPNGCGKSNVVDALRWVLGETRASSLRGALLEDVIFNGTETLRPLGVAEVSLVVRSEGESLADEIAAPVRVEQAEIVSLEPADLNLEQDNNSEQAANSEQVSVDLEPANLDQQVSPTIPAVVVAESDSAPVVDNSHRPDWMKGLSEVQITRRLYRSGESEFFINKIPCRLKDIKEVVRSLNLTARGYTVIAQGEISRVVTSRPEERRLLIEEIAQVAGFRDQIKAVKLRVEEANGSLEKLQALCREVTRTVQNLKRQAERAEERKRLIEDLNSKELVFFKDSIARAESEREKHSARRAEVEARISGSASV